MAKLKIIKLSDIQSDPVEWLWEPYIPRGAITLIQGDGGEGKTTVSLRRFDFRLPEKPHKLVKQPDDR